MDNVEIVRRIHDMWNRNQDPATLGLIAPEVEYVNPPDAMEPGTRRGIEGWQRAIGRIRESYGDVQVELERVFDLGDRVLALSTLRVRGRGSGVAVEQSQGYLWTLRDGRAMRLEWYRSHEDALAAAGLDPDQATADSGTG